MSEKLAIEFMEKYPNANPINQPRQFQFFVKMFLYEKGML